MHAHWIKRLPFAVAGSGGKLDITRGRRTVRSASRVNRGVQTTGTLSCVLTCASPPSPWAPPAGCAATARGRAGPWSRRGACPCARPSSAGWPCARRQRSLPRSSCCWRKTRCGPRSSACSLLPPPSVEGQHQPHSPAPARGPPRCRDHDCVPRRAPRPAALAVTRAARRLRLRLLGAGDPPVRAGRRRPHHVGGARARRHPRARLPHRLAGPVGRRGRRSVGAEHTRESTRRWGSVCSASLPSGSCSLASWRWPLGRRL